MDLLCLIRFSARDANALPAHEASELFSAALADAKGRHIHRQDLESIVLFQDPAQALRLLSDTMDAGEREHFQICAGLVQGIHSSATVASSLSGFTEASMETLFAITAMANRQQVAISARLSSLIELSAPSFYQRFKPTDKVRTEPDGSTASHSALVMGPTRRTHN